MSLHKARCFSRCCCCCSFFFFSVFDVVDVEFNDNNVSVDGVGELLGLAGLVANVCRCCRAELKVSQVLWFSAGRLRCSGRAEPFWCRLVMAAARELGAGEKGSGADEC